jgi:hypothetical protein
LMDVIDEFWEINYEKKYNNNCNIAPSFFDIL